MVRNEETEVDEGWVYGEDEVMISDSIHHFMDAAENGDVQSLREALESSSVNIDDKGEDGDTALHLACLYGHIECVKYLLEKGATVDLRDEDGAIPLHDACASGFDEIVSLLFENSSEEKRIMMLNAIDVDGDTPLHHAARGEHVKVLELLLKFGAHISATNLQGKTPEMLADSDTEAAKFLRSWKSN